MSVNRSICLIFLCAALPLAGCDSNRAPSFTLSEQSQGLSGFAQEKVQGELEDGFGTPASLVVWSQLDIDFGQYSGKVARVGPKAGVLRIGNPVTDDETVDAEESGYDGLVAASELASITRLSELRGAAVVVARAQPTPADGTNAATGAVSAAEGETATEATSGETESVQAEAPQVYRVDSYDEVTQNLRVVDADGAPAQLDVSEGDTVQIFGSELQRGRNLYLRHCMHCHGVSGDGAGPTAQYFKVKPRDYRRGIIKFKSTKDAVRPSRDDLFRIIKLGVPGTYMPSFMLLPDDEVKSITEYVRWLSMRGEMERKLNAWLNLDYSKESVAKSDASAEEIQGEFDVAWAEDASENIQRFGEELKIDWEEADKPESIVYPKTPRTPSSPESIKRGRGLFLNEKVGCAKCHGETAKGNGPSTEGFNALPGGEPGELSKKPGLFDDWGHIVKPRNLTTGVFRGGRRPIDIYRRIHTGIKGTPMPGAGATLTDEQIWDLVNYVLSIPYEDKQVGH